MVAPRPVPRATLRRPNLAALSPADRARVLAMVAARRRARASRPVPRAPVMAYASPLEELQDFEDFNPLDLLTAPIRAVGNLVGGLFGGGSSGGQQGGAQSNPLGALAGVLGPLAGTLLGGPGLGTALGGLGGNLLGGLLGGGGGAANPLAALGAAGSNPLAALAGGGGDVTQQLRALLQARDLGAAQREVLPQQAAQQVAQVVDPQLAEVRTLLQQQATSAQATAEHRDRMAETQFRDSVQAELQAVRAQLAALGRSAGAPPRW